MGVILELLMSFEYCFNAFCLTIIGLYRKNVYLTNTLHLRIKGRTAFIISHLHYIILLYYIILYTVKPISYMWHDSYGFNAVEETPLYKKYEGK